MYISPLKSETTPLLVSGMSSVFILETQSSFYHCMTVELVILFSKLLKPLIQKRHSRQTGGPVYLDCASARACQLLSCLSLEMTGIWDTILCNAIFKEILHNSSFFPTFFFWSAFLKVSLADPFNLTSLWSWSAKSWRLGSATSHGTGWYWNDNEVVFWKDWMN